MNPDSSVPSIDVCAGVIVRHRRLLLGQRPNGTHLAGKWEFPGGKVHAGESLETCIVRELAEELSLTVKNPQFLTTTLHVTAERVVRLHFLSCELSGAATHECREHQAVGWYCLDGLEQLDLAPADRDFVAWLHDHRDQVQV